MAPQYAFGRAGFANKNKFTDHFGGHDHHDVDARAMVDGTDQADKIANIAMAFEYILWDARKVTS